jgi:hypothetical protein
MAVSRTCLAHVWQPAADNNGCLAHFKFKVGCAKTITISRRAATPDQITQQNSLQRAGGP